MKRKTVQTKYDVPVRQTFRWASEQKFCEAELHEIFRIPAPWLTKEIIFVCTVFLFLYTVNALWEDAYTCPINAVNCTTKSAIYVMELWLALISAACNLD